jgi:2-C-methyl-D-erythritol 4-phosphate cytidylyltransferase/2-C-methyl-D-erythritol 2,4-cyclodiphosphate synthase
MRSLLPNTAVIIPAAGSGERLGADLPKALVQLVGRTLIEHAVANLSPIASQIIIAAPAAYVNQIRTFFGESVEVVAGGQSRTESVRLALALVRENMEFVLVHDAARALASTALFEKVIAELISGEKAVIPVLSVSDTIKRVDKKGYVSKTPNRSKLRAVQTPQGFTREALVWAHAQLIEGTDDAALVENLNIPVKTIPGEVQALKITTAQDLETATKYLIGSSQVDIRVGVGSDAHAFSDDPFRPMWLAGLLWEGHPGVDGHSDGDVAAHAICDSLFAATGLGDLGSNFGVDRPEYAGASGSKMLQETLAIISAAGFEIHNVSVQIVGNKPRIGGRRIEAIRALSLALNGAPVSVTATTTDGLGFTGEGKGLSAIATSLVVHVRK